MYYDEEEDDKQVTKKSKGRGKVEKLLDKDDSPPKKGPQKRRSKQSANYPIRASFEGKGKKVRVQTESDEDESIPTDNTSKDDSSDDNRSVESGSSDSLASTVSESSDGSEAIRKRMIQRKGCNKFFLHLRLLLLKNYWIFRRNLRLTVAQVIAPIFFCLLILFFQAISSKWLTAEDLNPIQHSLTSIPHCIGDPNCVTIGYSIIGDQQIDEYGYINEIMSKVAVDNQLVFNQDVKLLSVGKVSKFYDYLGNNPNMTWYGVVWCTSEWEITDQVSIPCQYSNESNQNMMLYAVYYNYTMSNKAFLQSPQTPAPIDPNLLQLKTSIDNAIMNYLGTQKGMQDSDIPRIDLSHSTYPMVPGRFVKDANIVSQFGSYFFVLGPLMSFTIMLNELVREKELRLRQGLTVVGVNHSVYWISWLIVALFFAILTTLTLQIAGMCCLFDIFWNVPFMMMFMIFLTFTMAMIAMAFFVSTLVQTQHTANSVAYTFILITIVFEIVFSQQDLNNMFFFNDATSDMLAIKITRGIFYMIPTFTLSLIYGTVQKRAATHLDATTLSWIKGRPYTWADFMEGELGSFGDGLNFTIPPPVQSYLILFGNVVLFLFLTWYLDHVISSNRGVADPPYFMFTRKYWGSCKSSSANENEKKRQKHRKKKNKKRIKISKEDLGDLGDPSLNKRKGKKDSVRKEKKRVKQCESNDIPSDGLRIVGLRKTYFKKACGRKSKKDVHAVRGVYLEIPDRELLCLLGHNGAGKSTLFSMMSGVLQPTKGTARICGYDLSTQIEEIRHIMGVVPQFDILWNELTANEHMKMFCKIKGVLESDIDQTTDELLDSVGLGDVKNARVQTFSGGMKRRLSVAISCIGDPRIIFMDEPTTGMDPVSRRDVWTLIQRIKRNKVMILTTHAMEEADILSDRIAVICDGKLKCVGTPLYLKNTYGDGYRITLVCEAGQEKRVMELMDFIAPSNRLVDESGGSMVFTVPITNINEIAPIFKLVEHDDGRRASEGAYSNNPSLMELKGMIKDCGISHTTLEEVFMKVTGKKISKYVTSQQKAHKLASDINRNTL